MPQVSYLLILSTLAGTQEEWILLTISVRPCWTTHILSRKVSNTTYRTSLRIMSRNSSSSTTSVIIIGTTRLYCQDRLALLKGNQNISPQNIQFSYKKFTGACCSTISSGRYGVYGWWSLRKWVILMFSISILLRHASPCMNISRGCTLSEC